MAETTCQLVAVIKATSLNQITSQAKLAIQADIWELRLDYLETLDIPAIGAWIQKTDRPIIITLRRDDQGGEFPAERESERLSYLTALLNYNPDYIDLEFDTSVDFFRQVKQAHPQVKIIASIHAFEQTPDNLDDLLTQVTSDYSDLKKIVTYAHNSIDTMRIMLFAKRQADDVTVFSMGEAGVPSRALSGLLGNSLCYVALDHEHQVVPEQLTLEDALSTYSVRMQSATTAVYGLIGDPVSKSCGHSYHNRCFQANDIDAVYVKFPLIDEDVDRFLSLAQQLPMSGLSVTMPLKLSINRSSSEPINTVKFSKQTIETLNTDGFGGINALSEQVTIRDRSILLLGAGGSAQALAREARHRGAHLVIANRHQQRAQALATQVQGEVITLSDDLSSLKVDIIINTLPSDAFADTLLLDYLQPILANKPVVMDIVYEPQYTPLLIQAEKHGCHCVFGQAMYDQQARAQQKFWDITNDKE